jgi:hypothetical protein
MAEAGAGTGDQRIAGENEIEPAAGTGSVDRGDGWCGVVFEMPDSAPSASRIGSTR